MRGPWHRHSPGVTNIQYEYITTPHPAPSEPAGAGARGRGSGVECTESNDDEMGQQMEHSGQQGGTRTKQEPEGEKLSDSGARAEVVGKAERLIDPCRVSLLDGASLEVCAVWGVRRPP